jgi:hypothetical protein
MTRDGVRLTAFLAQLHPSPAVLREDVLHHHAQRRADVREAVNHQADQCSGSSNFASSSEKGESFNNNRRNGAIGFAVIAREKSNSGARVPEPQRRLPGQGP